LSDDWLTSPLHAIRWRMTAMMMVAAAAVGSGQKDTAIN
jgi:hypothetical protein